MKEIRFVNAEDMSTLEDYAASLLSSMVSLRTLEKFHTEAFNKGLLNEDETETSKTICWEIHRLMALYKSQMNNILERTEISEEKIVESLMAVMPELKIPRKKKKAKEKKDE